MGTTMESPHKGKTGLRRLWNAFVYSLAGFRAAYKHEDAFRQEVMLAAVLITNPDRVQRLRTQARQTVATLTWEHIAEQLESVLAGLVKTQEANHVQTELSPATD